MLHTGPRALVALVATTALAVVLGLIGSSPGQTASITPPPPELRPRLASLSIAAPIQRQDVAGSPVPLSAAVSHALVGTVPTPPSWFGAGKVIFDDEFSGTRLDATKWSTCYPWGDCNNRGNVELQWYTGADDQEANGELDLVAKQQDVDTPIGTMHFTSGLVQTDGHFSFTHGYMEARAWLPGGRGFWPALWLLPTDLSWPPEIDAMEAEGSAPDLVSMTLHWGSPPQQSGTDFTGPDFTAGWHTFGVDWEKRSITWYVDGVVQKVITTASQIPNKPMYLIANLAIDGNQPPDAATVFPSRMRLDYVRVWQH